MKQNQRSIKNVVLTKKHHWAYLGKWVLFSLFQVLLLYAVSVYHVISVSWNGGDINVQKFIVIGSLLATAICGTVAFMGVLTAHRIAGVHIKLKNTFDAIREGDTDMRLRFRGYDRLDDVAQSFNDMMDRLVATQQNAPRG